VYSLDSQQLGSHQEPWLHETSWLRTSWLRTFSETTGEFQIGKLPMDDAPLGFLGADASQGGALGDMAFDNSRFFRCAERLSCQSPVFTFNGMKQDNVVDELSLRGCGSIGKLLNKDVCLLNATLFPVFMQTVWGKRGTGGCAALWLSVGEAVVMVDQIQLLQRPRERSLVCGITEKRCVYAPRMSLTDESSVPYLTEHLNSLLRTTGNVIQAAHKADGAVKTYENINRCAEQLRRTVEIYDEYQFNSAAPSGIYYALRVTLYEYYRALLLLYSP
jgi:hypothetical protein